MAKKKSRTKIISETWDDKNSQWIYEEASGIKRNEKGQIVVGSRAINLKGRGEVSKNVQANIIKRCGANMDLIIDMLLADLGNPDTSFNQRMKIHEMLLRYGVPPFTKSHKITTEDKVKYVFEMDKV